MKFTLLTYDSASSHYVHSRDAHVSNIQSMSNNFNVEKPERPISTTFSTADARTGVRWLSPWWYTPSWLTSTQAPQGKKSRGRSHPYLPAGRSAGKPTHHQHSHHRSLERDQLVQTFSINTCPKHHGGSNQYGGRSTSGGRENLGSTLGGQNLKLKPL